MKYIYKNTGIIVESGTKLDSTLFSPYEEPVKEPDKQKKPVQRKQTGRIPARSKKG